jgi:uncharacterized membrane protein (DUF2068 family)
MVDAPSLNPAPPSAKKSRPRGADLLRLIGVFKLLKGVFLIAAAISVFNLVHKDLADVIVRWQHRLHIAPGNILVEHLLEKALTVNQRQLVVVGIVLLIYAAMFTVEGIGLLLLKHWAEWMTVITTSGLIPIEIYEMVVRPSALKALTMLVNIVVAIYLVVHVRNEAKAKKSEPAG